MKAIEVMSALAQPTRLEVFTHLARARPDGLAPGALAERIGTPASTMSVHLTILSRAGLISSTKSGRSIIYKADPDAVRDLALFLMHDCCLGADVSDPMPEQMTAAAAKGVKSIIGNEPIG